MSWTDEQLTDMFGDDPVEKLAFLAGCHKHSINNSHYDGWIITDDNLRKFALLIVRECAAQIADAIPDTDCSASGAYKTAKIAAMARVKEYFGVEE